MGALTGYRVIELAGIGPAPMGAMILADMGAEVIRVERSYELNPRRKNDISLRNKKSIVLDLRSAAGKDALMRLIDSAQVLIDPFRPGVCEKLGIGPEVCLQRNPSLVFARMTGWGQEGPLSQAAGHDINYIAITGALHAIGRRGERPVPPLNLVGDMGGGGMLLVNGVLAALLEAKGSGQGQVVDVAMVDGTAQLMWMFHNMHGNGQWDPAVRESNFLGGAAYFYDTYECAGGGYVAIGPIEPAFHQMLISKMGLDPDFFSLASQQDAATWPAKKAALAQAFMSKTRDEWCAVLEGSDACFAPILSVAEAPKHPANLARKTYLDVDGFTHPAPAPRFSRTPSEIRHAARKPGEDTEAVLLGLGLGGDELIAVLDL